ncbi:hypothetical protein RFI_03767, partial [Reticulomyxa filosa]
ALNPNGTPNFEFAKRVLGLRNAINEYLNENNDSSYRNTEEWRRMMIAMWDQILFLEDVLPVNFRLQAYHKMMQEYISEKLRTLREESRSKVTELREKALNNKSEKDSRMILFQKEWNHEFKAIKNRIQRDISKKMQKEKVPDNLIKQYEVDFENRSEYYKLECVTAFEQICDEKEIRDTKNEMETLIDTVADGLIKNNCKNEKKN